MTRRRIFQCRDYIVLMAMIFLAFPSLSYAGSAESQRIFGWVEWVTLPDVGLRLKTKLDTGAATSSIHAENIVRIKRDGVRLVQFDLIDPDNQNVIKQELEVERSVRIREHDGSFQRRPVVAMEICLGGSSRMIEVNLVDRSKFNYPFLLGRSAMAGNVVVDPGNTFTAASACQRKGSGD